MKSNLKSNLKKRIVVCLDVKDGRTTKGVQFKDNIDIGEPVAMAKKYYESGADELVFYDIMASARGRGPILELIERVAKQVFIPFCVGGGISCIEDIRTTILAGAEKISLNSQAVKNPALIAEGARIFGTQCIVLGMDAKKDTSMPSNYRVFINGGRVATELDALAWAQKAVSLGAGEIVLNSIDADGTKNGYEIELTRLIAQAVCVPIIASGGAGNSAHIAEVFEKAHADAALIASIVHNNEYTIADIKKTLAAKNIPVRLT
ncbi:MAG: imidazole glycerol phosphate synthase subunit HisF [Treponemataceae bacterium]|nr:MAG: imidazole glycerol phosphate synthase subunit HisF [Treponemataceae bacterium]